MNISAALVKKLRERTGAGMMECKKALLETHGDADAAADLLRKQGKALADKKAGRITAEGAVIIERTADFKLAAMIEVNCETDFVAKDPHFQSFTSVVARRVLTGAPASLEALLAFPLTGEGGETVNAARQGLVAMLGENINVRRSVRWVTESGVIGAYVHGNPVSRIGVLAELTGGDADLAKDIAMHIAASRPLCVAPEDVPEELLNKEREILSAQASGSGKPADIVEKMVEGRLKKYLAEVTLLGQPFIKDTEQTVGSLLKAHGAIVKRFVRFEVGGGIEKKAENFAQEVMAQVREG
jgi:translation elongation factor Ts